VCVGVNKVSGGCFRRSPVLILIPRPMALVKVVEFHDVKPSEASFISKPDPAAANDGSSSIFGEGKIVVVHDGSLIIRKSLWQTCFFKVVIRGSIDIVPQYYNITIPVNA